MNSRLAIVLISIAMLCTVILAVMSGPTWPLQMLWLTVFTIQTIILILKIRESRVRGKRVG